MNRDMEARRRALEPQDAARLLAGRRDHGLGAAALQAARRAERALDGLRVMGGSTERLDDTNEHPTEFASASAPKPAASAAIRRAALHQALRR